MGNNKIDQQSNGPLPNKNAKPGEPESFQPQTGIFQGETYSMGPGGIFIGGKSFATASPTTATLPNGKTVILGPSGVSVQNAADVLPITKQGHFAPSQTGIFQGESYSMGRDGIIIGGKSFAIASPTTATLPNGKTVILGPSGVSVQNAADILSITQQGEFAPKQTGIFQGVSYSIGSDGIIINGKSFATASPTTATLPNGKVIILGPSGLSMEDAADMFLSITRQGGSVLAQPQTGMFHGMPYSLGSDGAMLIDGKSFAAASPTTATLPNGKILVVGPSGVSVQNAPDFSFPITKQGGIASPKPQTGMFHGMPYSLGSDGTMIVDGKSFDIASPTTATLPNGKVLIVGPSGVSVQNAPDFSFPISRQGGIASPKPQTGMFHGMPYSIGSDGTMIIDGKSFPVASPTTATLPNGKVLIVGPTGVSVQDAADVSLPITRKGGFSPQTGLFHGEAYSMGLDGTIVIGEKSFATASPTTATLPDGKVVIVGPNGVSIQGTTDKVLPPDVTNASESLPQTGMFHGESYSVGPSGVVVLGGKSFTTASPTTATLADGKIVVVGPSGVSVLDAANDPQTAKTWVTPYEYIVGGFLPTIIAVIYSIPWYMLASALQEIQPFYQLQSPDGVTAEDSIGLGYRTSIVVVATFTAMRKGHHLVWWSGLISTVNLFIAPLATGTVFIGFTGICTASSGRSACFPTLSVYPIAARVLQALLALIALLTLVIAVAVLRKRSGVYANPLSIAGLATLFQNQQVIEDFRRLNPYYSSSRMIKSALRENRYQLGPYVDDDGTKSYGFKKCYGDVASMDPNYQTSFRKGKKYASVAVAPVEDHGSPKKTRTLSSLFLSPITIVGFGILVIGLETLVIYYNRTGGNTGFERWMDSQSFGVSFTFTAVGVILKLYWTLLDEGKFPQTFPILP